MTKSKGPWPLLWCCSWPRRRIILLKAAVLSLALFLGGLLPGIGWLLVTSLLVGISATLAQDIVPLAATLAPVGALIVRLRGAERK